MIMLSGIYQHPRREQQDTTLHRTKAETKILCHLILSAICGKGLRRVGKEFYYEDIKVSGERAEVGAGRGFFGYHSRIERISAGGIRVRSGMERDGQSGRVPSAESSGCSMLACQNIEQQVHGAGRSAFRKQMVYQYNRAEQRGHQNPYRTGGGETGWLKQQTNYLQKQQKRTMRR